MKIILSLLFVAIALGQDPPPLKVHRTPPLPSQADLQKSLNLLKTGVPQDAAAAGASSAPPVVMPAPGSEGIPPPPKGWKPRTDVQLDPATQKAVTLAKDYLEKPSVPIQGEDGRLRYIFGGGLATVVCAPLHLCALELEPGEKITDKPLPSDLRWEIILSAVGVGDSLQTVVLLRPHESGLDSNLVILTNKRSYYLRLVSKPTDYMAKIGFIYPDGADDHWKQYQQQVALIEADKPKEESTTAASPAVPPTPKILRYGYTIHGRRAFSHGEQHPTWWPTEIFDDGTSVYITLPERVLQEKIPSIAQLSSHGQEPTDSHWVPEKHQLVVHNLFEKAQLFLGTGRKQQIVTIKAPAKD